MVPTNKTATSILKTVQICLTSISGAGNMGETHTWWTSLTSQFSKLIKEEEDEYFKTGSSLAHECMAQETQGQ